MENWQVKDDAARSAIGSVKGDHHRTITELINDKLDVPLSIDLSGDVLTISASTQQLLESDEFPGGWDFNAAGPLVAVPFKPEAGIWGGPGSMNASDDIIFLSYIFQWRCL